MIRLTPLAIPGFDEYSEALIDFDMDGFGRCVAVLRSETATRILTDQGELALPPNEARWVGTARLLPGGKVLLDPIVPNTEDAMESCAIATTERFEAAPFGVPYAVFTAGNWTFVTYSEHTIISIREPSFENDVVTVFDGTSSRRLFGLTDILTRKKEEPDAYAVTRGCATRHGGFSFVAFGSTWLWTLNAETKTYHAIQPQASFQDSDEVEALATDGDAAVLMFARQDGLELAWVDRGTGECSRRETVALATIANYLDEPLWRRPAGNWGLNARVRGLDDGRFLICTSKMVLLLDGSSKGNGVAPTSPECGGDS